MHINREFRIVYNQTETTKQARNLRIRFNLGLKKITCRDSIVNFFFLSFVQKDILHLIPSLNKGLKSSRELRFLL